MCVCARVCARVRVCAAVPDCLCLFVTGFCDVGAVFVVRYRRCVCVRAVPWFALAVCVRVFVALWLPLPGQYFYFQEVLPVLAAKHCIMQANAELHQSILAKQKKRFGEEIARLQVHSMTSQHDITA